MDVSNSNISNLFACLSNINDKFENKIVKVQETVSHQIENFDSIIDSKINDNNQIINKSISDINDLLNFGSNTSKVYSKDEVNENFLDKSAAENKFNDFNTKINTTVYSKEDTNKLLAQKLNSEIINNYFDKPTIENKFKTVYSKEDTNKLLAQKLNSEIINNYLDTNSISTELQKYCLKTNLNTDISELQKIKDIEGLITSNKSEIDIHETSISKFSNILNFEDNSVSKVYSKDQINSLLTNDYLNKSEVQSIQTNLSGEINKLKEILDFNNETSKVYSKEVIDNKLLSKANSEDVYTITSTNELLKNKLDVSEINNYPNKTEVDAIKTELSNQIQSINDILNFENENSKVYSKEQVDNQISNKFNSLFDSGRYFIDTISVEAKLVASQVTSIGSLQIYHLSKSHPEIYPKTLVKIYGNLRINKKITGTNNSSEVETVIGKSPGAAGIISLGVNLRHYYTYNTNIDGSLTTVCTNLNELGAMPLNFHVISIVPGSSSTSEVRIYFEGYKFGKFLNLTDPPTADYLDLDFQYYSANYSKNIYKWIIEGYIEVYKI